MPIIHTNDLPLRPGQKRGKPVQQQLIKLADAAKRWGISPDLIKQLIRKGTLRAITLSDGPTASKLVFVEEMDAFIEARLAKVEQKASSRGQ